MINKAVLSYFNPDGIQDFNAGYKNTAGFLSFQDMIASTVLSIMVAKQHFKKIEFVTNEFGKRVFIDKMKLPVDLNLAICSMDKVSKYWWGYGKIIAYSEQKEPFVHLDNDVFFWSGIPEKIQYKKLIFQSKEFLDRPGFGWYNHLKKVFADCPIKPQKIVDNEIFDYAYNCGICGGHELDFFQEWKNTSASYIFEPANQYTFFHKHKDMLIHENLFHEQYFAACLIKANNLRKNTGVLADDAENINKDGYKYTHMWGLSKKNNVTIAKVYKRLKQSYPEYYDRIMKMIFD